MGPKRPVGLGNSKTASSFVFPAIANDGTVPPGMLLGESSFADVDERLLGGSGGGGGGG